MKKLGLLLAMAAASFPMARAAISVGPGGSGLITFETPPTIAQGWATVSNTGTSADITTVAGLSSAVASNSPGRFTLAVPATSVVNPITAQATFAYNTVNQNLQSVPTGSAYNALLATLQNDSGAQVNVIFISFELGEQHAAGSIVTEEVPGFHVYFSLTGVPGSWQEIPSLAGDALLGTRSAMVNLGGTWPPGAQLFIIWADDNANANRDNAGPEEGGYTIDNVVFSPNGPPPNSVTVVEPANGATFPQGVPIRVSAVPFMSKPVTNVAFFQNGLLIGNDATSPYSVVYTNASLGTHTLTAAARDDTGATVNSSNQVQIIVVSNSLPFLRISLDPSNTANVKLDWAPANWRLQGSPSVSAPSWSDFAGAAPPLLLPAPPEPLFFRTISPDGTMFSPNVVGAVPLTILPGYTLMANPLLGTNNQLGTILPLANDGTQDNVQIIRWSVAGQKFDGAITWFSGIGWIDESFQIPTQDFNPGEGFVIRNPNPAPFNVALVGDVAQGNLSNLIPTNRSFLASQVPQTGTLDALGFPAKEGYQVSILNPGSAPATYTVFQYSAGVGWMPGAPEGPTIPVGTGFVVDNPLTPQVWNRMFSVDSTPPSITQQPQDVTVPSGNSATFSVTATGTPPISFQWFFRTNAIPGANGSNYTILSAQLSDAGRYHVRVTNPAGSRDSSNATLKVFGPIVINEWMPVNGGIIVDPADGKPDDWFELYNAGAAAVPLGGFHLTDNLSDPNKFTIPPGIMIPPHGYLLFWADNQPAQGPLHANFVLPDAGGEIALFNPGGQLMDAVTYAQGTPNASLGREPDGGEKIVTFVAPTPNSSNAGGPPAITVQPSNQMATCFGTATFVAGTSGSLPATYQWVRNGCDVVPGADAPFLTLQNVNYSSAGNYSLIISNAFGRVASDDISLGIIASPTPQLTWTNGTNAIISWPSSCPDFFIEQAPDFNSAVWASAGPVTQNGSNYFVTIPFGTNATNSLFYRLRGLDTSIITSQPMGRAAGLQETVQLTVGTTGSPSGFQWRHNGRAMFNQSNSTLLVTIASNANYGAYEAVVFANGMSYFSAPAFIRPTGSQTFLSDSFAGREIFTNLSATIHGTTAGATHEPGEPQHADVPGGKSVWLSWRPPASGIATFDTLGSGFDTVLAVYQPNPGGPTELIASDDDSGGFLWSKVSFNVKANTEYAIALDGAAGASGFFVLKWGLEITSNTVPIILAQPQPVVVMSNQLAVFSVTAASPPPFGNVGHQWFRNSTPIQGATNSQFAITNVTAADVDDYFVVVGNGVRAVESRHALLQISSNPADFHAEHKTLVDLVCGTPPSPVLPDAAPKLSQPKVIAPSSSGSLNTSATPYNPPTGLAVCCLPPSLSPIYYTLVTVTTSSACAAGRTSDLTFSISGLSSIAVLTVFENSVLSVPAKACATTINPTVTVAAKRNTSYSAVVVTSCSNACFTISYTNGPCR